MNPAIEPGNRDPWRHPIFIAGVLLAAIAIATLPVQYIPVLWRHDRSFIAFGITPFVIGALATATRRPVGAAKSATVTAAALIVVATFGYRLYEGIGWPDPVDVAITLAMVAAPVWVVAGVARRRRLVASALAVVVSIATVAGFSYFAAAPGYPRGVPDRCRTVDMIEYCFFDGFAPFVNRWSPAVGGVVRRLPDDVRAEVPRVLQAGKESRRGALATPFLNWDRPRNGTAELSLALDAANWALGIDEQFKGRRGRGGRNCTPRSDDGRAIIAYWLAGQATREAGQALRGLDEFADSISGTTYAAALAGPVITARDAVRLLDRPAGEVGTLLRERWNELSHPDVTVEQVRRIFGLPAQSPPEPDPDAEFYTQDCV